MPTPYGQLDAFSAITESDPEATREIAGLLERRSQAPQQVAMREGYLDLLGVAAGERVLEVGCGTGPVIRAAAGRVGSGGWAVGIDPSPVFIEAAREHAAREGVADRMELRVGDGAALPFADGSFDVALAVTTLAHMPRAERAIAELVRAVRPGGRVGVFENEPEFAILNHPDRGLTRRIAAAFADHSFHDSWLIRRVPGLLEAAGLAEVQVRPFTALERDTAGWYARLWEIRAETATRVGVITAEERDGWLAQLRAEQAAGRFLAAQTALFVWGQRPGRRTAGD